VILPQLELGAVEIVAEVLAQSVAMDYYADDVAEIEAETDRIAGELRKVGRIPGRVPNTLQFIGLCIATRNDVISTLALFDKPDATWENEQLDRLWNGLRKMLELDDRYRALDAKLRMFQDNLVLLVDLARQRQTFVLEFAVAILIAMEMAIMVWQIVATTGHS
jgi:required for meiotic nuclear division protein 1